MFSVNAVGRADRLVCLGGTGVALIHGDNSRVGGGGKHSLPL